MKNFQKTLSIFVFALLLTGVFTLGGCEKNELSQISNQNKQTEMVISKMQLHPFMSGINETVFGVKAQKNLLLDDYKQVLKELDFVLQNSGMNQDQYERFVQHISDYWFNSSIEEIGYPIEGDGIITRKTIQDLMKARSSRHIMHTYRTSSGTKTVRVHKNVNPEWKNAISQAVAAWNSLGYKVKFAISYTNTVTDLYNTTGEIDVKFQSTDANGSAFSSSTYASTLYPTSDNAIGEALHINSTHTNPVASAKKMVIAHELGHAIGMKHTDAYNGFGLDVPVQGCGVGTTDATSIMKDGSTFMYDGMPWQGFSACDKKVIDYYWGSLV